MNTLHSYYQEQITKNEQELKALNQQLLFSSLLRLSVFILAIVSIYFMFNTPKIVIPLVVGWIALFTFLVLRHSKLESKKSKRLALIQINQTEIDVLKRNFHHLPTGDEFKDANHYYSQDIDLFGLGSFYQYLNRTVLQQGSEKLASLLTDNHILNIVQKQEAIKELAAKINWRQEFSAIAQLVKVKASHTAILLFLKNYTPFIPKHTKALAPVFGSLSIVLCLLYYFQIVPGILIGFWLLIGLSITGTYFKKIKKLSNDTDQMQSTFQQYQKLILSIENTEFTSELLQEQKQNILDKNTKTSTNLEQFAKLLYALDQSKNLLMGMVLNGFFLWDIKQSYKIEQWILQNATSVKNWFDTIAFFDAYNSLGNFSYNHPDYNYPVLANSKEIFLNATALSHPLLDPKKSIPNNVSINKEHFFIVTGANMAGKSTFLRTISLQIVMSNLGLPVCAKTATYTPTKLVTSMRTTDSLTDDTSYFFSELKRLKFVIDEASKDNYFIVLDEILKGTNSTDKAKGSKKLVEKLVSSKSTGIIATHDLSLCELENKLTQVKNYYFDAEIRNDELFFDYSLKEGVCKNMNASFLLKKMQIVD